MTKFFIALLTIILKDCHSQEKESYRGKLIGKLDSYHHQVSGEVYAVDEWTIYLVNFNYDGMGDDTYFWAGESGRPGPQGFIVPDENGRTNVLDRYYNQQLQLKLPDGKKVSRLKWFAIYDIDTQNVFADVYIPDDYTAPSVSSIGALNGAPTVSSQSLKFITATTFIIPEFSYDGTGGEVYFWCGVGPQPSSKGYKIPDEFGYLEPLRTYKNEDIQLDLPGVLTVFDINWISIYSISERRSLAFVLVPEMLNVPPSSSDIHPYKSDLPSCKQLHRDFQISWEVFGPQVTFELAAKIRSNEYMAFGISGSDDQSHMIGADVAVTWWDQTEQRGFATDYNITAKAPCVHVLGKWEGVCRDSKVGGQDSNQVFSARRQDGLTVVSYRRNLEPTEPLLDREWKTDRPIPVVWAIGTLDADNEPSLHHIYHKQDLFLHLGLQPPPNDCFNFTMKERPIVKAWERAQLFDPLLRVFKFALGPSGGVRGLASRSSAYRTGHLTAVQPLAWYVNGQLSPDLQLRRGLTYNFKVMGGNDPHSASEYHPLVVTDTARGGLDRLEENAQRAVRVMAGVRNTRRSRLAPVAAGPLCVARRQPEADPRRDESFVSFRAFNRTLQWQCDVTSPPAELTVTPDSSWPDIVYYNSFTHPDMSGRIFIVDRHKQRLGRATSAAVMQRMSSLAISYSFIFIILSTFYKIEI